MSTRLYICHACKQGIRIVGGRWARHWIVAEQRECNLSDKSINLRLWKASDEDHIPRGRPVLLRRAPLSEEDKKELAKTNANVASLGLVLTAPTGRRGTVVRRRPQGDYEIRLDENLPNSLGNVPGEFYLVAERADIIYPIPENVLPLARRAKGER